MKLGHLLILSALLLATAQVDASFWDGIPIISQIKSAFQALTGDTEGAKKTQENFVDQAPGVSQIKSAVQSAKGDNEGAKKTQEKFLHETIEPVAENTPGVGHLVGAGHIIAGNKEKGEQIIKSATTNTAALAGGLLGGPAGALAAGAAMDGLITGVDSAVHGEFRPQGTFDHFDKMAKGELSAGDHFDFIAGVGAEFAGGKVAKDKTKGKGKDDATGGGKPDPGERIGGGKPDPGERIGAGSGPQDGHVAIDIDKQIIKLDPTDGSHNIETGKTWKPPRELSLKEFDQLMRDLEEGKNPKDFYHVEHWPEPYRSKLQQELSKLSPEHKKHISGRDLKMIINDEYAHFNCYYCSIARSVGISVLEMERRTGIKISCNGEIMPRILDIADRVGLKPKVVMDRVSKFEYNLLLDHMIGRNQHKKFLISYEWTNAPGGHMTNFEAWRTSDGKLHQLHKDFQQPSIHPLDRGVRTGSRFSANMPENIHKITLIEVFPELAPKRRRRSTSRLDELRAKTGLPAELAEKLNEEDFDDNIFDVSRSQDPFGELSATARALGMTVSGLVKILDRNFANRAPDIEPIRSIYKKLGFDGVSFSKAMKEPEFMNYLREKIKNGDASSFTLMYWPRGAVGWQFLAIKAWKTDGGQLNILTTDHAKQSGIGRFSDKLPVDALWLHSVVLYNTRDIGQGVSREQLEKLNEVKRNADASGNKCGGEQKRIIGYVANWADKSFTIEQAAQLTNAIYAFMEMGPEGRLSVPENQIAKERLVDLLLAREAHERIGLKFKVSFAVGGWANSQHFSPVLSSSGSRQTFISEIERILNLYKLDGVDIDWEYPITGGATQGKKEDRENYVAFLRELRARLGSGKLISIAAAAGQEAFEGFDVKEIIKEVDWIGVMSYDFFGAWDSQWGAYVGPLAPLKHGSPPGYSGKLNVDWAMKQYSCLSDGATGKLVMGVPFYGRYWFKTSPGKHDATHPLFRTAERMFNGSFGGEVGYRKLMSEWNLEKSTVYQKKWDERTQTPWATDGSLVLTYEDTRSIGEKMKYAAEKNFGGVMIWSMDHDDNEGTLMKAVFDGACHKLTGENKINYKCNPLGTEKRWWTWLEDKDKAGMCGVNAPLYKGFYPRCDPDDPGYSCCSKHGYCGTGDDFCKCDGCLDFGDNPDLLVKEPTKPSGPIKWHVGYDIAKSGQPRCGSYAPKLADGSEPTCNPDGNDPCCSRWGYCGTGDDFCKCDGCVDARKKR